MPDLISTLLTHLHRVHLKPRGYGKDRHTFSRDVGSHTERFNFQGSGWSSANEKRFYINVGIAFPEYPDDRDSSGYFSGNHWACRIDELVAVAAPHWDVDSAINLPALAAELATTLESASTSLSSRADTCREVYRDRRMARLGTSPAGG